MQSTPLSLYLGMKLVYNSTVLFQKLLIKRILFLQILCSIILKSFFVFATPSSVMSFPPIVQLLLLLSYGCHLMICAVWYGMAITHTLFSRVFLWDLQCVWQKVGILHNERSKLLLLKRWITYWERLDVKMLKKTPSQRVVNGTHLGFLKEKGFARSTNEELLLTGSANTECCSTEEQELLGCWFQTLICVMLCKFLGLLLCPWKRSESPHVLHCLFIGLVVYWS